MPTLPDASINGSIVGGGTSASFAAGASCFGGEPSGSVQGNIRTFTGSGTSNFTFNSSNAFVVVTVLTQNLQFAHVKFDNVTIRSEFKQAGLLAQDHCLFCTFPESQWFQADRLPLTVAGPRRI